MLNNGTDVTPVWLHDLAGHLSTSQELAIIGPMTNASANEAKLDIGYIDIADDADHRHGLGGPRFA
jgi:hypothetical protein